MSHPLYTPAMAYASAETDEDFRFARRALVDAIVKRHVPDAARLAPTMGVLVPSEEFRRPQWQDVIEATFRLAETVEAGETDDLTEPLAVLDHATFLWAGYGAFKEVRKRIRWCPDPWRSLLRRDLC